MGRLAQWLERVVDIDEVTGANPVSPTSPSGRRLSPATLVNMDGEQAAELIERAREAITATVAC